MTVLLDVHLYGRHVAELLDAGQGEVAIAYTTEAQQAGAPARLSLSLPVRVDPYPSRHGGQRWVRSILPERDLRDQVALRFGVDPDDGAGLLRHIGRDVAGAAVVVPAGESPHRPDAHAQPIAADRIAERIARLPDSPLGVDPEAGVRLSLAGQQHKLLLTRASGSWALPVNGEPSTVIVKPEPVRFPGLVTNELFALRLARAAGLAAADATFARFASQETLVVERFDRRVGAGGAVARIHQEDVLGAAGFDPLFKYQQDDEYGTRGPALVDIARLLEQHLGRAELLRFAEVVTFNLLLGNADAHARNLSLLLHDDGRVSLAPLYDLVCTLVYPEVHSDLPQWVGQARSFDEVDRSSLLDEAAKWGLPERLAGSRISRTVERVEARLDEVAAEVVTAGGDRDVADAVVAVVRRQCKRLAR